MLGFGDVTRLALQPSVLDLDPEFGRALFLRDIARTHQGGTAREQQRLTAERAAFDEDRRHRETEAQRTFRTLPEKEKQYHPSGNPNQYMIDAILRDNAIAQYDRDAPRLREEMARARAAQS